MTVTRIVWVLMLLALGAATVQAQPQRGGGSRGMPRGPGVEQVLAFLAFDESVAVSDKQLVEIRAALRDVYARQQEMGQAMREARSASQGDFEAMREMFMSLREEMGQLQEETDAKLAELLTAEQSTALKAHVEEVAARRQQQFGGGGRRGGS